MNATDLRSGASEEHSVVIGGRVPVAAFALLSIVRLPAVSWPTCPDRR